MLSYLPSPCLVNLANTIMNFAENNDSPYQTCIVFLKFFIQNMLHTLYSPNKQDILLILCPSVINSITLFVVRIIVSDISQYMAIQKCVNGLKSRLAVVLGSQWGDEGKGKLVSVLSDGYNISARFNGGANAGHTVVRNGVKYAFHLVPSAIVSPNTQNLLGNGVVVNLEGMFKELSQLDKNRLSYANRMFVSDRAHLVTKYQLEEDAAHESKQNLGTTKKGIGPTYAAKIQRYGLRVGDLVNWDTFVKKYNKMASFYNQTEKPGELEEFRKFADVLQNNNMIVESVGWINNHIRDGKRVLVEGANATLLDIDLGTYPYVTSSSTSVGGVCTGLGIAPHRIETYHRSCQGLYYPCRRGTLPH